LVQTQEHSSDSPHDSAAAGREPLEGVLCWDVEFVRDATLALSPASKLVLVSAAGPFQLGAQAPPQLERQGLRTIQELVCAQLAERKSTAS